MKNHYEILGISENAPDEVIKAAYKAMAKKYHPDLFKGDQTFAEEMMKKINTAYDILSNPGTKAEYDRSNRYNSQSKSSSFSNQKNEQTTSKTTSSSSNNDEPSKSHYDNENTNKNADNMSKTSTKDTQEGEKSGSVSCCLITFVILIIIVVLGVKFIPKLFSGCISSCTGESISVSEENQIQYTDQTKPEYWIAFLLDYYKGTNPEAENVGFLSQSISGELSQYISEIENTELDDILDANTLNNDFAKRAVDFKYSIIETAYNEDGSATIVVDISYTDYPELYLKAQTKSQEEYQKLIRLNKDVTDTTMSELINNYLEEYYPKMKNNCKSQLTFILVRNNQTWSVYSCDDTKALVNSVYANIYIMVQ